MTKNPVKLAVDLVHGKHYTDNNLKKTNYLGFEPALTNPYPCCTPTLHDIHEISNFDQRQFLPYMRDPRR